MLSRRTFYRLDQDYLCQCHLINPMRLYMWRSDVPSGGNDKRNGAQGWQRRGCQCRRQLMKHGGMWMIDRGHCIRGRQDRDRDSEHSRGPEVGCASQRRERIRRGGGVSVRGVWNLESEWGRRGFSPARASKLTAHWGVGFSPAHAATGKPGSGHMWESEIEAR